MRDMFFELMAIISLMLWPCPEPFPTQCPNPVVEYTTGDTADDTRLYEAEGWEIIQLVPYHPNGLEQKGWIALTEVFGEGDERFDSLITDVEDLSQVFFQGNWLTHQAFEELACQL